MSLSIRVSRVSDARDIAALTGQLGYDVEPPAVEVRLARILAREDQTVFVAELDGRPVGWVHAAMWQDIEAEAFVVIGGLVVDRNCRGKGVGRRLMEEAEEWTKARGCSIVRLWSSSARTGAHRFYEELGYTNIKTQHSFAKVLDRAAQDRLSELVPRVEP
jgi:GNAT superfamily N-acetyltransferase